MCPRSSTGESPPQETSSEVSAAHGGLQAATACLGEAEGVASVPLILEALVQWVGTV